MILQLRIDEMFEHNKGVWFYREELDTQSLVAFLPPS